MTCMSMKYLWAGSDVTLVNSERLKCSSGASQCGVGFLDGLDILATQLLPYAETILTGREGAGGDRGDWQAGGKEDGSGREMVSGEQTYQMMKGHTSRLPCILQSAQCCKSPPRSGASIG